MNLYVEMGWPPNQGGCLLHNEGELQNSYGMVHSNFYLDLVRIVVPPLSDECQRTHMTESV